MEGQPRKEYYLFSPFLRIFHWIMVLAIVTLFVTGLLITKPVGLAATDPTSTMLTMDMIRSIHFLAAFIFCAAFILRIYGFIVNKGDRLFPHFWEGKFYSDTLDVMLHYMLIKKSHAPMLRNPLARGGYAALYGMVFVEILTGFAMYFPAMPNGFGGTLFMWVNTILGGEYMTHYVHHIFAWFIILFALVHVYMVFREDFMDHEGEASSMFSGVKIFKHVPVDVDDVEKRP